MIYNAPPALLRSILAQPEDLANQHPYDVAAWWMVGRAGHAQPADSASLEPNVQADRASRRRWPRLRRTAEAVTALCDRSQDEKATCVVEAARA